jgi:hypothetical protein
MWRTVDMDGPTYYRPLCLCLPSSIDRADTIPVALTGYKFNNGISVPGAATNKTKMVYNPN